MYVPEICASFGVVVCVCAGTCYIGWLGLCVGTYHAGCLGV